MSSNDVEPGLIAWPTLGEGTWHDTGEGGLWAYAYWLAKNSIETDPLINCFYPQHTISLSVPDAVVNDESRIHRPWGSVSPQNVEEYYLHSYQNNGPSILSAVFLGSIGIAYDDDLGYFKVLYDTLTDKGKKLIDSLNTIYGREAVYVTYLDT